jgi:hypothetical protein
MKGILLNPYINTETKFLSILEHVCANNVWNTLK